MRDIKIFSKTYFPVLPNPSPRPNIILVEISAGRYGAAKGVITVDSDHMVTAKHRTRRPPYFLDAVAPIIWKIIPI